QRHFAWPLARSGKTNARPGHALGVLRLLSVPDHLVGQLAGRDPMVRAPDQGWLAMDRPDADSFSFRSPLSAAAVERPETQCAHAGDGSGGCDRHAIRRPFLAYSAGISS